MVMADIKLVDHVEMHRHIRARGKNINGLWARKFAFF